MSLRPSKFSAIALAITLGVAATACTPCAVPPAPVTGELRGDMTWQGEVRIGGDVTVSSGSRLTIQPGTVVRFLPAGHSPGDESNHPHFPGYELNVAGVLSAIGTAEAPVVFMAADEQAPPGSWGAVNFAEGSRGILRYCIFRQADSALHSREATVEVTDSRFERNLVAVRFHTSVIRIENNLLRNNGTGLRFHYGAPIVRANRFENNRVNLFITSHPRDYLFESNRFGMPLEYHVVLGEDVPEDVFLRRNTWETPASEAVSDWIFDGRRAPYLGRVETDPQLKVEDLETEGGPSWMR